MSDQSIVVTGDPADILLRRVRRFLPLVTFVLIALNAVIFLLMELAGGSKNPEVLLDFGAAFAPYFRHGQYWRLVMPMFLHIGWLHLLVNMYALYILGPILERVYGYGRYALLYVGTGIGSSWLSMRISTNIAAGASGAIFGIAGIMLVTGYLHRDVVPPRWGRAFGRGILPFILLNLVFGFSVPHIDNWGHIGGLVSGMLLAWTIPPPGHAAALGAWEEERSEAILIVPVVVVALAIAFTAQHYQTSRKVSRLLKEATRLRTAGQADQAVARYQDAARLAPHDERPHLEMGSMYVQQKHPDDAIREFEEALRLSPGLPQAQLGLVLAYRQKGDFAKARQMLEAVVGKNPRSAEGQLELADLLAEQKLYPDAIQHYQEALRLKPDMPEAHNNLAWLLATSEDPKYRNPGASLDHARRAVELTHWREPNSIDTLAEAFYANGNFQEAVRVQTKALQLDPQNREFQEHMARYRKAAGV